MDAQNQIQDAESGPKEFLQYMEHAEFVVTNSFHGTVFSILFHKPFYSAYAVGANTRIEDLLEKVSLQARHIENVLPEKEECIDWATTDNALQTLREKSWIFLDAALH